MKLFKRLLIAPATLGLLAPLSVTANETNFKAVSSYSSSKAVQSIQEFNPLKEVATSKSNLDISETRFNNYEAGSFSETTTMAGSAAFQVGSVDQGDRTEAVTATYSCLLYTSDAADE